MKVTGKFVAQAKVLERVLSETFGKHLPINADDAIAALSCEMNFPPIDGASERELTADERE